MSSFGFGDKKARNGVMMTDGKGFEFVGKEGLEKVMVEAGR